MDRTRVALLSDEQRAHLRLVREGLTSKEIAQRRGGSHHTVNAKIAVAVQMLGARDRDHAAEIVTVFEPYERSYEPPELADTAVLEAIVVTEEGAAHRAVPDLPVPIYRGQPNKLTFWQRVIWVLIIAATTALLVGGLISGITAQINGVGGRP